MANQPITVSKEALVKVVTDFINLGGVRYRSSDNYNSETKNSVQDMLQEKFNLDLSVAKMKKKIFAIKELAKVRTPMVGKEDNFVFDAPVEYVEKVKRAPRVAGEAKPATKKVAPADETAAATVATAPVEEKSNPFA